MAAWAGLPLDLVGRIQEHLPCLAHRAAFGAVCKNWRAAGAQHPPPPQLPWLLLPPASAAGQEPCFFCLVCKTRHRAALPDDVRAARCVGSFRGGWLILALQQGGDYAIHNLHNPTWRYYLPEVLRTPDPVNGHLMVIHAACGAALVEDSEAVYFAAIGAWSAHTVAFWRITVPRFGAQEVDSWGTALPHGSVAADGLYFRGHGLEGFHVLTEDEKILVYVPGRARDGTPTTRQVTYSFPDHLVTRRPLPCYTISRYLIDFFGQLVMVVRSVLMTGDNKLVGTLWIQAFQLTRTRRAGKRDERLAHWERFWFPDKVVVMLGRCSSRAFVSPAVALNGIYFLDDANSFEDMVDRLQNGQPFPCTDMGKWTAHDQPQEVEKVFQIRPPSEFSPAVWFFH